MLPHSSVRMKIGSMLKGLTSTHCSVPVVHNYGATHSTQSSVFSIPARALLIADCNTIVYGMRRGVSWNPQTSSGHYACFLCNLLISYPITSHLPSPIHFVPSGTWGLHTFSPTAPVVHRNSHFIPWPPSCMCPFCLHHPSPCCHGLPCLPLSFSCPCQCYTAVVVLSFSQYMFNHLTLFCKFCMTIDWHCRANN